MKKRQTFNASERLRRQREKEGVEDFERKVIHADLDLLVGASRYETTEKYEERCREYSIKAFEQVRESRSQLTDIFHALGADVLYFPDDSIAINGIKIQHTKQVAHLIASIAMRRGGAVR